MTSGKPPPSNETASVVARHVANDVSRALAFGATRRRLSAIAGRVRGHWLVRLVRGGK